MGYLRIQNSGGELRDEEVPKKITRESRCIMNCHLSIADIN